MNNRPQRNFCLLITGFDPDIDRKTIKNECIKYGFIEKLYLDHSGSFAKVFYAEKKSCDLAFRELNNGSLNWQVQYFQNKYTPGIAGNKLSDRTSDSSSVEATSMASYGDYEDDDFTENFDYCNIHGQPLVVLQADSGDMYVNLKDVRRAGFAIFRRDTFDSVLVDKRQVLREFELHLLSEAKNYILKNKVAVIDEEEILKTIERCKNKLLGENCFTGNQSSRSIAQSSGSSFVNVNRASSNNSFPTTYQVSNQRPPKTLPNNFTPSNTQRNEKYRSKSQDRGGRNIQNRDNKELKTNNNSPRSKEIRNSFASGSDAPKQKRESTEHNFSSGSDPKTVMKPKVETATLSNGDQKNSQPLKEEISKLTLEIGMTYQMQVVFNEEKENVCWVQKKEDANTVEDVLLQINEAEADLENITPQVGQLVIAEFEGVWSRGQVMKVNPPVVHFVDYGNNSAVGSVKPLPEAFKKIPALAVRIVIEKRYKLNNSMAELMVKIKQQYDDGTYLVELITTNMKPEKISKPAEEKEVEIEKQKLYYEIPKPMGQLKNGDKVMVVDTENNKFLVRTRECAQKTKEITEYIKNLDKSAFILTNVKVGQLILCSKDGLVGLYRAIITKKEGPSVVTVKYIDFPGEDDLSIKSLRNVDEFLAHQPSSILLTPEHKSLRDGDEKVAEYVSDVCKNKEKFTVILSEGEFDLQYDDGTLLSQKLVDLRSPKKLPENFLEVRPSTPKETEKIPTKAEKQASTSPATATRTKVTYDEMEWINVEPGTHSFMCYRFKDLNDVTMISATEDVIGYLEEITGLEVEDNEPYKPEEFEMCLVSYKGPDDTEASWFRAAVVSVEDDSYDVTFVDFGNQEKVKSNDIRKFPSKFKNIPMLGINCELVGIPGTPEIVAYLQELIPEGEQVDVLVKRPNGLKYQIEIPTAYEQLKTKGLC